MSRLTARPRFTLFAPPFGLAGLAGAMEALPDDLGLLSALAGAVWLTSLVIWLFLVISYTVHAFQSGITSVLDDLRHPITAPFAALGQSGDDQPGLRDDRRSHYGHGADALRRAGVLHVGGRRPGVAGAVFWGIRGVS